MKKRIFLLAFSLCMSILVSSQNFPDFRGEWSGWITQGKETFPVTLELKGLCENPGFCTLTGTFSEAALPKLSSYPLSLHWEDGAIFLLQIANGWEFSLRFRNEDHGTPAQFTGTPRKTNMPQNLVLFKAPLIPVVKPGIFKVKSREIQFEHDSVTFSGTLCLPKSKNPVPALILISGSGAQDRNEEILGFRPFQEIADYLSQRGIAVLRYDDRGVGKTQGGNVSKSTTEDFAGDVQAAVGFLRKTKGIRPDKIGLMGHSEGAMVAQIVAHRDSSIAALVFMGGPCGSILELLDQQGRLIRRSAGMAAAEIEAQSAILYTSYDALKSGSWEKVESLLSQTFHRGLDTLSAEILKSYGDTAAFVRKQIANTRQSLETVWMRYFLYYQGGDHLPFLRCPILALFGGKDLQVPPSQNIPALLANTPQFPKGDLEIQLFPEANHLFQDAETGGMNEYASLPKEWVPGFLPILYDFLSRRLQP